MTQMTQSFKASARAWPWLLGHLGYAKTMTQMTQSMRAAWPCWRQFKTVTQMTQVTQSHAAMQHQGKKTFCLRGRG
jgi:hypothetical protein